MTMQVEVQASEALEPMTELEKEMIRDAARGFASNECPLSLARSAEAGDWVPAWSTWTQLAELGWLELLLDEESETVGLAAACIIGEELGRASYPLPFAEVTTLIAPLLSRYGSEEQKARYLEPLVTGQLRISLATPVTGLPRGPQECVALGDGYTKPTLIANHLADSDLLMVPVQTEGGVGMALFESPEGGWQADVMPDMANSSWTRVTTDHLDTERMSLVGDGAIAWDSLSAAYENYRLTVAATVVGLSAQALDLAVDYAKERIAFGKPIGSFQAVQQRLAESAMEVAAARLVTQEASLSVGPGPVAAACIQVMEASKKSTFTAQQVWGGMGYTLEVDVQLFFRRARAMQLLLGHPWELRQTVWEEIVPH